MKNVKIMKGGAKTAMALLQYLHGLHGKKAHFTSLLVAPPK